MAVLSRPPRAGVGSAYPSSGRWTWGASTFLVALTAACGGSEASGFGDAGPAPSPSDARVRADATMHPQDASHDAHTVMLNADSARPDTGLTTMYPAHRVCHSTALVVGSVPAQVGSLFKSAQASAASAPALVYPTSGTMLPPNMADVLFQWRAPSSSAFWLHFFSAADPSFPTLDVYTDGQSTTCTAAATGGECWESGETDLMCYLGMASDRGTDEGIDVDYTIAALDTTTEPATKTVSPQYVMHVAKTDITGAVYYWSTTSQGIRRALFDNPLPADGGTVSPPGPIDYITNAVFPDASTTGADQRCAACHSLSHDGTKLAVSLVGDVLGIIDIVPQTPPPITLGPASQGYGGPYIGASWTAFSWDATKIITASTGTMTVRSVATGDAIGDGGVIGLPDALTGSMPDWSPDEQHIAFASTPQGAPNTSYGRHLYGSSIAMMTANGDGFDTFQIVAQSTQMSCQAVLDGGVTDPAYLGGARETFANPMFSLDNQWLIFSHGACESEDDPTAVVLLAPAQANAPLNPLTQLNTQLQGVTVSNVTNGMPVWGPTNDPKIRWIAFTSTRDYGLVLTNGSKIGSDLTPPIQGWDERQLWIAAVDLSKVADGGVGTIDPSYPAFRFSAQDLTENNHRPFWTVDTLPEWNNGSPPPPPPK